MRTVLLVATATLLWGCAGREHLGPGFGKSVRAAFAAQVLYLNAGEQTGPFPGLDPQEASIVVDTYFKSLAPEKAAVRRAPMLIVEEPEPARLPPPMGGAK